MADTKRQAGNKSAAATPSLGTPNMVSIEAALSGVVGARIRVVTTESHPQALEGTVFTYCPFTHLLALNTAPPPPTPTPTSVSMQQQQLGDYHVIPISRIQSFALLGIAPNGASPGGFENVQPSIESLDLKALKVREENAVRKLHEKEARRGKGVGKEGQDIFDALSRTLPTRWAGTSIVVLDSVTIAAPYRPSDCDAPPREHRTLMRVRRVLENERKKISERNGTATVTGADKGPIRKGG
ncbi:hypothetical protein L228DRAFT_266740 [Xylona heveae TC161]|uniref:AD domain-containing protein n=1 Tax=Xylona heveae (strain CBS 132557 / TC161) TaxID=1328760 RepID=A0A161TEM6_XYLHT|nr:hypothetical protein L228DRAFT_266740 [Xylona heveae TC161]KZF24397.1 hypothetical protein L228DRAFT_266740 [Xylona heveae TC161]